MRHIHLDAKNRLALRKPAPYREKFFRRKKKENCIGKILFLFLFFAQNIHCVYTLEPGQREAVLSVPIMYVSYKKNKKIRYTLAYPSFAI